MADELPVIAFATAKKWEQWLGKHHATSAGIWLQMAKKGTGVASVNYREAVEVALCYGWIDGQSRKDDDPNLWVQRFTPRRAKSKWSKINTGKVEVLIAAGRMQPAGQAEIDRAKADGRWDVAYASPRNAEVPADFQAALDAEPAAAQFFVTLTGSNRYAFLHRIADAKKPETRVARIEKFVALLKAGEKLH